MKVKSTKEYDNEEFYKKLYKLDGPMDLDSIITMLKNYENEQTKMAICNCSSFSESGSVLTCAYYGTDELADIKNLPSPYVRLSARYLDRKTEEYKFSIITSTNSDCIEYMVNKELLPRQVESSYTKH